MTELGVGFRVTLNRRAFCQIPSFCQIPKSLYLGLYLGRGCPLRLLVPFCSVQYSTVLVRYCTVCDPINVRVGRWLQHPCKDDEPPGRNLCEDLGLGWDSRGCRGFRGL